MAHEEGNLNDLRAILGNDVAIKASREGQLPFPDGTIIAGSPELRPVEESSSVGRLKLGRLATQERGSVHGQGPRKYVRPAAGGRQFDDGNLRQRGGANTCFPATRLPNPRLCLQPLLTLKAERGEQ